MVTKYDYGNGINIAGNTTVNFMPAVADPTLKVVKLTEWDAGTTIQCAIRSLNATGSTSNRTEQFLCDSDVTESAGSTSWSIDPIVIQTGDPQEANPLLDGLTKGQIRFIGVRLGLAHDTAAAAAQKVRVFKVEVSGVEDVELAANADGNKYETRIHLAIRQVERNSALSA